MLWGLIGLYTIFITWLFDSTGGYNGLHCMPRNKNNNVIQMAVLLTNDSSKLASISKVGPAILYAVSKIKDWQLLPGKEFEVIYRDTQCSNVHSPIEAIRLYMTGKMDVLIGPSCDYAVAPVGRLMKLWNLPLLTAGALAHDFGKNKTDPNAEFYLVTRLGLSFNSMAAFLIKILERFNWRKVKIVYESDAYPEVSQTGFGVLSMSAFIDGMKQRKPKYSYGYFVLDQLGKPLTEKILIPKIKKEFRNEFAIIVLCANPETIRNIMLAAESLNMVDSGEYVFINIDLFESKNKTLPPWYKTGDSEDNNIRARKAFEALLTVTARTPDSTEYKKFSMDVKRMAKDEFNFDYGIEQVNPFVTAFHEAVILYALGLNDTLNAGYSVSNGSIITKYMWNRTFVGITGNVSIDENGDRNADYSLFDMNPKTGIFEVIANYYGVTKEFVDVPDKKIHWAGGRKEAPPDTPTCGFDGSGCPNDSFPEYAIVSLVMGILVCTLIIASIFIYRHYKLEAELAAMTWRIRWEDIMFGNLEKSKKLGSKLSLARSSISTETIAYQDANRQIFAKTGYYKATVVAIKKLGKSRIEITRQLLMDLKRMRDIQHDHTVRFIGACIDPPNSCIVTEYCPKGSLQDILENEQIKLDWMFRYSLMHDIIKGMAYLQSSEIRSHGNLKSSNCVVDSRFVLKITDFGLHYLRQSEDTQLPNSYEYWRRKLWTAPELLRLSSRPLEGTQKGDVYSFAIIVQEIVYRNGPFYLDSMDLGPEEIIQNVKNGQKPPFRPTINPDACDEELTATIQKCWSEEQIERPDFQTLKVIIRKLNRDNESGNILDNLLSRMEQYAINLESLVQERTADYLEEKRRAEELLYQLLPKSVAEQLIKGEAVTAEAFDMVTIYFSDIVGFTAMSAQSTPMQIVDFLNDLYTCFDSIIENFDVYKVETIGDAYMVVSGLPVRNGNFHAKEIARMSLALLNTVMNFKIRHRPGEKLKLRIGMHTGPCVAGVVGLKMPRYCLFGDTVNTASRMESNGLPLRIHVSPQTKEVLDTCGSFKLELRGEIEMKGKGKVTTYWLLGEETPPSSTSTNAMTSTSHNPGHTENNQKNLQEDVEISNINVITHENASTIAKNHI